MTLAVGSAGATIGHPDFVFSQRRRQVDRFSVVLSTASAAAKQPSAFNQDGRFSLFSREKKSAEKRENLDTAKAETPSDAYGAESGVSFCLPEQPASSHSAEKSALR